MEFIEKGATATETLTSDIAQEIYDWIKECGNSERAFKKYDTYLWKTYKEVDVEVDRIKTEVYSLMSDSENRPQNFTKLYGSITSDYLDVETVCDDIVAWMEGRGNSNRVVWADFLAYFESLDEE